MENKYNKKLKIGRIKLNSLMDWAFNLGKNNKISEYRYKELREERVGEIK